jgi:hypothetical protein
MKRGQTALEYLMTYGWALVVIVIVIAALYYFGVFSPPVASTCVGFTEFAYKDHALYAAQDFQLQILGGAQDVNVTGISLDAVRTDLNTPSPLLAGQSQLLTFPSAGPGGNSIGDPYRGMQIIIHYNVINGQKNQSDAAQCSGSYQ